jgi:hypothetical protein
MPISRRELYLDHGRVFIEVPRLMTDRELADVLEAFVKVVRGRAPKAPAPEPQPSTLPAFRKRKPR